VTWSPGDPWPGTPGGASSPHWGGYVRLYVRAAIRAGNPFHLSPHDYDRLDAGNVLAGGTPATRAADERLWADLSCDVIDVEITSGGQGGAGILTASDAATCQVTLADPDGIYDPTNPDSPWVLGSRSRLVPGVPVEVWSEVVDPSTSSVSQHHLFTGTADSWGEDWTPTPSKRRATLVATDATKQWVRYDRPEQPPVGAGDTTAQRVDRLVAFYGWTGVVEAAPSSTVTLAATTLAASGWELLGRTLDDELGVVYFTPTGALRWTHRAAWFTVDDPIVELGCETVETGLHDVITDASPSNIDVNLKNVVRAARTGGTVQTAQSTASIRQFGRSEYPRTDLGLETDAQAGRWATDVVTVAAYPRVVLENVTLRPGISPTSFDLWPILLDVQYVTDVARIVWAPPDRPAAVVEVLARVVGSTHRITRAAWVLEWQLAMADVQSGASVFTLGPHVADRLDAGNVLAFA
jgi:hypothetical protein